MYKICCIKHLIFAFSPLRNPTLQSFSFWFIDSLQFIIGCTFAIQKNGCFSSWNITFQACIYFKFIIIQFFFSFVLNAHLSMMIRTAFVYLVVGLFILCFCPWLTVELDKVWIQSRVGKFLLRSDIVLQQCLMHVSNYYIDSYWFFHISFICKMQNHTLDISNLLQN